jgi:uncharacterized protein (UPF0264 family)
VSDPDEAAAALAGGAEVIDAKDPSAGPLGALALDGFREIVRLVGAVCPVSAALGDADDERTAGALAEQYARAGARFVKLGFARRDCDAHSRAALVGAAVERSGGSGVIAVVYCDRDAEIAACPEPLLTALANRGAAGVLLDTADKRAPGLRRLLPAPLIRRWIEAAHARSLLAALAGRLAAADLPSLCRLGPDLVGVRGAACEGGRTGRVASHLVARLRTALHEAHAARGPLAAPPPAQPVSRLP